MAQRAVPAPFLTKTYEMVEDESSDDVISWNDGGTSFVVWKTAEFARDLLPNSFKHNNFSSFVRQLNTYGFRKTVPNKWEFANENFKRGHKELLTEIRRRKAITTSRSQIPVNGKSAGACGPSTPSNSGEDHGSISTSSPDSKNLGSVDTPTVEKLGNLSDENEKLKREKQLLSWELEQTKKQCDDLIAFLTQCVKVGPDQINRIMSNRDVVVVETSNISKIDCDDGDDNEENKECFKLFGVVLKEGKKKRGRDDKMDSPGSQRKEMKKVEL